MSVSDDTKSKQAQQFFSFVGLIQSVTPLLFPSVGEDLIDMHLEFLLKIYQCRGKLYLVRYLKATVESFDSLVLMTDSSNSYKGVSIGLDHDGWPKWLGSRLKRGCLAHIPREEGRLKRNPNLNTGILPMKEKERLKRGPTPENLELIRYVQTFVHPDDLLPYPQLLISALLQILPLSREATLSIVY